MALTEKTQAWLKANTDVNLSGRTVLITGANSGAGFKTAETMADPGASVILACRNTEKAAAAKACLLADYTKGRDAAAITFFWRISRMPYEAY